MELVISDATGEVVG